MYSWFETEDAYYMICNNKYFMHLKEWDSIPALKYHYAEIDVTEYAKAYFAHSYSKG